MKRLLKIVASLVVCFALIFSVACKGADGAAGNGIKSAVVEDGRLILILDDGSRLDLGLISGAQGEKGETGEQGPKGDQGEKGETGEQGPKGDQGEKGETGEQGPKGDQGEKGETGEQGPKGDQGEKGETGEKGDKGDKGETGATGKSAYEAFKEMYPDYAGDEQTFIEDLVNGRLGDFYIKSGAALLTLTVTDKNGLPVANAVVYAGEYRYMTNADGEAKIILFLRTAQA